MKKYRFYWLFGVVILISQMGFIACDRKPKQIVEDTTYFVLPLEEFGASKEKIASLEKSRNSTVELMQEDPTKLVVKAAFEGESSTITYFFQDDKYTYALGQWESPKGVEELVNAITQKKIGFVLDEKRSVASEQLYTREREGKTVLLSLTVKQGAGRKLASYSFGPLDEQLLSPTRCGLLTEGDLFLPLVSKGLHPSMMWRYEELHAHAYSEEASMPARGVFTFLAGSRVIERVKYWYDVKTQSRLEECGIYFHKGNLPEEKSIEELLTKHGFAKTKLTVKEHNTVIYYDAKHKCVAQYELTHPADKADFEPYLQFYFYDLSDKLPKEKVNFPMPILEFNKMLLSEAVEKYKQKEYYKGVRDNELGGIIDTNSEDFDMIIVGSDDGTMNSNYLYCCVVAKDERTLSSPMLLTILTDMGFVEKKGPALPTYVNETLGISCQFDFANFTNMYCLTFEPLGL